METWRAEMHHGEHTAAAAHCDEELGNFVGVDVSWGWRTPSSRDKTDETNHQS